MIDLCHQDLASCIFAVSPRAMILVPTQMDLEKPIHLQSPRILQQYETNLIRARRNYDLKGPGRLKSQTFPLEYKTSEELVKVASLEYAESVGTSEHAPAVVAVILDCIAKSFQADYVFMGSFGVGGKRVGEMGSVTDYMLRLCNHTMVVVKHWRPVPKQGEGATFLVCLDGSPAANEGLEKVIFLARDGDKLVCVTVSRHKGPNDVAIIEKAQQFIQTSAMATKKKLSSQVIWLQQVDGEGTAAEHLIRASERFEADFLVFGSINTAHGAKNRESLIDLGSTALYCSRNSKCHAIIVKPPFPQQTS
mmetsp:Transcript_1895/g.5715  ORF Transcript_1895/g.5715 Transcript_1895/m.5715 type:complete len:307 (-) Transcript_1895:33-953(-)